MKFLFLITTISIASLCSCEYKLYGEEAPETPPIIGKDEPPASIIDTTWKFHYEAPNGEWWYEMVIVFTSTEASFTKIGSLAFGESFTGRYTYEPPEVVIYSNNLTLTGQPGAGTYIFTSEIKHKGTITGETMMIDIISPLDGTAFACIYQKQ